MKWDEMKWNEWTNEMKWSDMNEWMKWNEMNEWMNEMKERKNEWMNGWMDEWINESMNQWINESMNESMNRWINEWMNECMNEWTNELTNERMNGWLTLNNMKRKETQWWWWWWWRRWLLMWLPWWCGWHDDWDDDVVAMMVRKHMLPTSRYILSTSSSTSSVCPSVFLRFIWSTTWWWCGLHMNARYRYSLVRLLPTSSSQSAPSPTVFYDFYVISSSRCSLVRLLPPTSSSKRALHPTVFYDICETELPLQSCALFKLPRSSRAPAETETLLRQPRQPLYPKERRVSRPTVFSSLNSRDPDLLHFPTTWWWWCGCHDDVVDRMIDMMIWLPWWWESWPWQASVTRKFSN